MTPWQKEMLQRELGRQALVELEMPVTAGLEVVTIPFDANLRIVGGLGPNWNSGWYWTARAAGTVTVAFGTPPFVDGLFHLLLQRDA